MLKNWFVRIFWDPFEAFCLAFPLIPIRFKIETVAAGVQMIRLDNVATKVLSRFGGGFDYAVIYLVDSELIFDTGYSWANRTLKNKVFKIIDPAKIKYVINSHDHEDHTGNNSLFLEYCPCAKIYSNRLAMANILFPPPKPWYRRFLFGPEVACAVQEIPTHLELSGGRALEVIATPGHTDGHICLYDRESKILFTGDLFVSETLDTQLEEVNGPAWIKSLQNVLNLEIEFIFDGHGLIFKGDECKKKLSAKLDFLLALRSRVKEIIAEGPIKQAELIRKLNANPGIVNALSMGEGWMSLITDGNFSRSNLIRGFVEEVSEPTREPDYYLNEQGLMVFTRGYHLRRGYCCGNNCKHCPYPKEKT